MRVHTWTGRLYYTMQYYYRFVTSQQERDVESLLFKYWTNVFDVGATQKKLTQRAIF